MKSLRRETKINLFSVVWTVGILLMTMVLATLINLLQLHPSSGLRVWVNVLIGAYGLGVFLCFEHYQKLLDERVRLRNAEAARLTFSVLAGAGMVALLWSGVSGTRTVSIDLPVLFVVVYCVYLVSYFVLWVRSR